MITTLIVIGLLIIGVVCTIAGVKYLKCPDWVWQFGLILFLLCGLTSVFIGFAIIDVQVNKDIKYQNALYEKEMLEYRIDNMEDNIIGNEMLYNDIVEFNNDLREVKKWANNPWVNWFYNQDIATIDYVKIDGH